jgi:hypothetical protein
MNLKPIPSDKSLIRAKSNEIVLSILLSFIIVPAITILSGPFAFADDSYQLGHGYNIGPFNFAGYSDIVVNIPDEGHKTVGFGDLSLFVTGHVTPIFNPFIEAELTHFDFISSERSGPDRGNGSFILERLYDDITLTDAVTFRFGKMLAPVGEWNQIHAAPLVLAAVRPAVTDQNFSEFLTGASLLYGDPDGETPGLQLYWQPAGELFEQPSGITPDQYQQVEGLHITYPLSLRDQIGFSFQRARDIHGIDQSLFGLDFQYRVQKLTLQGEGTYADLSGHTADLMRRTELGGYLGASYAFAEDWSVYGWHEEFAGRQIRATSRDILGGVAYRPDPAMVLKFEYLENIGGTPVNPTGLFMSWSILF